MCRGYKPLVEMERISFCNAGYKGMLKKKNQLSWLQNLNICGLRIANLLPQVHYSLLKWIAQGSIKYIIVDDIDVSTAPWCVPVFLTNLSMKMRPLLKKKGNIPNYYIKSSCHLSSRSAILSGSMGLIQQNKLGTNMWNM